MATMRAAFILLGVGLCLGAKIRSQEASPAAQTQDAAPAKQEPHNNIRPAIRWKQFEYTCEGGAKVSVYLGEAMAKVLYEGHKYLMKQTMSADGNRYSDGEVVWWGKGEGGFLQEDTPEWNGKMIAKDCKLDKPAETPTDVVSGSVTYLQRMALPPNAIIEVKLQDVSQADAPAKLVAEQTITLGNRQVPVLFELKFDPAKIDPRHSYSVSAKITVDNELRFITEQAYPVLSLGNTSHVDIILKQATKNRNPK